MCLRTSILAGTGQGKSIAKMNDHPEVMFKAGVHLKAVLTSLNTAFLPISRSRFKQR